MVLLTDADELKRKKKKKKEKIKSLFGLCNLPFFPSLARKGDGIYWFQKKLRGIRAGLNN